MTERAAWGTANTTAIRADRDIERDGKALTMWKAAAVIACDMHLVDLHRERNASRAKARLVGAQA